MADWFVVNAREASWSRDSFCQWYPFDEGRERFPQVGINLSVIEPGGSLGLYHGEDAQEDFLVLDGECVLLVEGEERRLGKWDIFHCPPWTEHMVVGAGERPCVVLAVGARPTGGVRYPVSELAKRYRVGAERETGSPPEAYANYPPPEPSAPPELP